MFRSHDRRALALLALLIAVLYADILLLGRGLFLADLTSYHYPMKWIVRDVVAHGEFPFWNRFYAAGQPLAANPAYEVFYPLQWLIWLPSYEYGFQLHILLHFVIAAWGMYAFLRGWALRPLAAAFGAAAFVVSGPYLSLSSKLPLLFSLSWMPLALHVARRAIDDRTKIRIAAAAVVLAMQFIIGEPTIALQTWLLIGGYVVWRAARERTSRSSAARTAIVIAALAACIAAAQLVPGLDFTRDSVRSEAFPFQVVANWSMPLVRPVEMVLPSLFRHVANERGAAAITTMYPFRADAFLGEIYLGAAIVLLAIAGMLAGSRGAGVAAAIVAGSIVLAAGEHTPLLRILYDLHLFRSLRYPEKFIVTAGFVIVVWAAMVFDRIAEGDRRLARSAVIVGSLWLIIAIICAAGSDTGGALQTRSYFAINAVRAAVALVLLLFARRRPAALSWQLALAVLTVGDLAFATRSTVPRMPRSFFTAPPLARELEPYRNTRIFPEAYWQSFENDPAAGEWMSRPRDEHWWLFRNALGDHLPARWGYEMALDDDVDRTSLKTTDALREAMKQARASRAPGADAPFLKMAAAGVRLRFRPPVGQVGTDATPVEIAPGSATPRYAFATSVVRASGIEDVRARLDEQRTLGLVAFAPIEPFAPAPGEVTSVSESANSLRLNLRASGRAFLVISATGHRYWSATLDGAPVALIPTNVAYQGIVVPPGAHTLAMRYRNPLVAAGVVISVVTLFALGWISLRARNLRSAV